MNRKTKYYSQVKNLIEGLIVMPETDENEDRTLRAILNMFTEIMANQSQEPEVPVQQPTQDPQQSLDQRLMNTYNLALKRGGGF